MIINMPTEEIHLKKREILDFLNKQTSIQMISWVKQYMELFFKINLLYLIQEITFSIKMKLIYRIRGLLLLQQNWKRIIK